MQIIVKTPQRHFEKKNKKFFQGSKYSLKFEPLSDELE